MQWRKENQKPKALPGANPSVVLKGVGRQLGNERGGALVLALAMLTIMSILGVFALSTSTTEVQITGNYRTSQQAFYAADRAVQFGLAHTGMYAGKSNLATVDANNSIAAGTSGSSLKSGEVAYLGEGPAPPGSGTEFASIYHIIKAVGGGPNGAEARVEAQVQRLTRKDTSIFDL